VTDFNLPDKDDAPWLDCMDGFQNLEDTNKAFNQNEPGVFVGYDDILDYARQLANTIDYQSMKLNQRYDLEIPENTHWELVKLAADLRMHHEDYALNVLIGHVENELDQKSKDD